MTAFIASWVVRFFEPDHREVGRRWRSFMPIVAGMGGNAGTQTLTVFVRGARARRDRLGRLACKPIWKELLVGFGQRRGERR